MTAPAHTSVSRQRTLGRRGEPRLPWWAVALPAVAFCALLMLTLSGGGADASQRGHQPLARLLAQVEQSLSF